jgi:hypothetical protein
VSSLYAVRGVAVGVAVAPNGRILVVGTAIGDGGFRGAKLTRLTPDGSSDPSFGVDGVAGAG